LVARLLWEQKVPGSSPGAPTKTKQDKGFRTIREAIYPPFPGVKADVHPMCSPMRSRRLC
jgi:hypothetical protein